ncbi:hypothetical protein [Nostoc sp. WHI]|uniref:hypothetical protein n=1 Tax=Nostoc sp. WHI TaxID=2650611 RepID=UPI0018C7CBB1|nr:hypothetical protein [Nostoc sp. WHI]
MRYFYEFQTTKGSLTFCNTELNISENSPLLHSSSSLYLGFLPGTLNRGYLTMHHRQPQNHSKYKRSHLFNFRKLHCSVGLDKYSFITVIGAINMKKVVELHLQVHLIQ